MISPKKLIKMARKWQKLAAIGQKRILSPKKTLIVNENSCSTSSPIEKGHFVVYSADQRRFVIPFEYLNNDVFRELFEMSEEEFGLPSDGPIIFPCDAFFMEYILSLIQRGAVRGLEKALIMLVASNRCFSSSSQLEQTNQQLFVY